MIIKRAEVAEDKRLEGKNYCQRQRRTFYNNKRVKKILHLYMHHIYVLFITYII